MGTATTSRATECARNPRRWSAGPIQAAALAATLLTLGNAACATDSVENLAPAGSVAQDGGATPDGGDRTDGGTGGDGGGGTCDTQATFTSIYNVILNNNSQCAIAGCHAAPVQAGLDLSGAKAAVYANLVGASTFCMTPCNPATKTTVPTRVKAGDAMNSFLYLKVSQDSPAAGKGGARMPLGTAPLSACEIEAIRTWIAGGAMDD